MEQAPAELTGWAVPQAHLVVKPAVPLLGYQGRAQSGCWCSTAHTSRWASLSHPEPLLFSARRRLACCPPSCTAGGSRLFHLMQILEKKIEIKVRRMIFCSSSSSHLFLCGKDLLTATLILMVITCLLGQIHFKPSDNLKPASTTAFLHASRYPCVWDSVNPHSLSCWTLTTCNFLFYHLPPLPLCFSHILLTKVLLYLGLRSHCQLPYASHPFWDRFQLCSWHNPNQYKALLKLRSSISCLSFK